MFTQVVKFYTYHYYYHYQIPYDHFYLIYALSSNLLSLKMVQTRSQLENLSKDELIDEVLSLENFKNDINVKFSELNDRFNDFEAKYEMVTCRLQDVVKNFYLSV